MKTLKEFLVAADHYLYPNMHNDYIESEKQRFLTICEKNSLDEEFLRLVRDNRKWTDLVRSNRVFFFINDVKRDIGIKLPIIRLCFWSNGTEPVIELLVRK